ncbi:MAG: DCC1-like thiol-disulfide oxidoreductase family protein [Saprospiraceae bacterium]
MEDFQLLSEKHPIIVYDGECHFCNYWVQFILKRDKNNRFYFADRHSNSGKNILNSLDENWKNIDSIFVYKNRLPYVYTSAVEIILTTVKHPLSFILRGIPKNIADFFYKLIAKNRHNIPGFKKECVIPTVEQKSRFLP